jgi:hypothetical protein
LVDIFYPSAGTVFSKEGVFQQPQAIALIEGFECNRDLAAGLTVSLSDTVSKIAVSIRSLVVRKLIWVFAQIAWLSICLASLIGAYKAYRGISDWQVEEGLGFEMMALSFPSGFVAVAGVILAGMSLRLFGLALPASSKPEMFVTWLLFVIAGYVQWFIVVPRIPRWWKGTQQKQPPNT